MLLLTTGTGSCCPSLPIWCGVEHARLIAEKALALLAADGISDEPMAIPPSDVRLRSLPAQAAKLLLKNSISPLPLHKVLVLKDALEGNHDTRFAAHELLALARVLPTDVGNLRFGPEVGVGKVKQDARVVSRWLSCVLSMSDDLRHLGPLNTTPAQAIHGDARTIDKHIEPMSAERDGYKVEAIDLFRTRHATATNEQLREEVLVLRWPGAAGV